MLVLKNGNRGWRLVVLLLGLCLAVDLASHLVAEVLWFQEVGYRTAFLLRLKTQLGVWAIACFFTASFLLGNLTLASRLKYPCTYPADSTEREKLKSGINLRWLLPIVLVLSLLVGLMLLHYSKISRLLWHSDSLLPNPTAFEPNVIWEQLRQLSVAFKSGVSWQQLWQLSAPVGQLVLLVVILIAVLVNTQFSLSAIAVCMSLFFSWVLSANWGKILLYFHPTAFNIIDPLFKQDIRVYVFSLPVWQLLEFWLGGIFLYGLLAVTLIYLLSGDSLSQGRFPGFERNQLRHLCGLGSAFMLNQALRYWLNRYELLYSPRGVTYGASYTDVHVQLPIYTGLSLLLVASALFLLWQALEAKKMGLGLGLRKSSPDLSNKSGFWKKFAAACLPIAIAFIAEWALPAAVQRFVVQPNELAREREYIEHSIAFTRKAFNLENSEVITFNPQDKLTAADIKKNKVIIDNIRLWDTQPLLETNRQLQEIRSYYNFPNANIDRYALRQNVKTPTTAIQQLIIAARELDYNAVPQQAKTWVNEHLVYTHGYGFTMSPVNIIGSGGLPEYFVKDIGDGSSAGNKGNLRTSSDRIRLSIPIKTPRIYYGQITDTYVITGTNVREFDYPSGNDNFYNSYSGRGGVAIWGDPISGFHQIDSWWRRLLFAEYLRDWQMLLTRNFTPQTKVLFRRNIKERVRVLAPMLQYDRDPYLVVADANPQKQEENYLYWILDAYTSSDRYPYSDPGNSGFNYIRNSVKVVIDAYHGSVDFYVADTQDPIIQSWNAIFPTLFKPLHAMPANLLKHIRYPVDLFSIQSDRLRTYHMRDPQVFYNREDQWQVPTEIYGGKPQPVEPYYLIAKLPAAPKEEFILLLPFTPTGRTNLIAWLAARSDGEEYGKLLLYQFPKQQLVYGPEQIEALINQDPVISQQISLWNRSGSRAIQGNLLVIPIERTGSKQLGVSPGSLLYVEPLYLEAEQNSLPTLVRVIVAYSNRIVMAQTLNQALQAIFSPPTPPPPALVRPVKNTRPSTTSE